MVHIPAAWLRHNEAAKAVPYFETLMLGLLVMPAQGKMHRTRARQARLRDLGVAAIPKMVMKVSCSAALIDMS